MMRSAATVPSVVVPITVTVSPTCRSATLASLVSVTVVASVVVIVTGSVEAAEPVLSSSPKAVGVTVMVLPSTLVTVPAVGRPPPGNPAWPWPA